MLPLRPAVVADYASSNGYLDENLDTKWELMTNGVEHFGISGSILGLDENAMINVLSVGCPIICSMGPGIFTTTGHFIVLTGYQDGAFTVHDPPAKYALPRRTLSRRFPVRLKICGILLKINRSFIQPGNRLADSFF